MLVARRFGLLFLTGITLSTCGKTSPNTSSVKDIGSDISTGTTVMYWAEGNNVYRGTCEKDKPLLRTYCQHNIVTRKAADANAALLGSSEVKHAQLTRDKEELTTQLSAIDDALQEDPTNADLSGERERVALELRKVGQVLQAVDQYYNLAKGFIEKIDKSEIVYKISNDSDRYADLKPMVQTLANFFNSVPTPTPTATWIDPATKRTFAAVKDRYTWSAANSACQLIPQGTWIAVTGYLTGGCHDNIEVGKRLFHSPLMNSIPESKVDASGKASKVVWSRCFYDGGLPIAIGVDGASVKHYGLTNNTQLPVICERVKNAVE